MGLKEDVKNARERWQHAVHEVRESRDEIKRINKELDQLAKEIKQAKDGGDREKKLKRQRERKEDKLKQEKREKENFAEMRDRRDKVKDELVKKLKRRQDDGGGSKPSGNWTAPGYNTWGGCRAVTDNEVVPVLNRHGIPITSRKRTETYGNPTSDHHVSQTMADAVDGGAANAFGVGDEIGGELGVGNVDDYVNEYFTYNGVRFRVQIIAATHGTGPHIHTGIRRA